MLSPQVQESLRRFIIPTLAGGVLAAIASWQISRSVEGAVIVFLVTVLTPLVPAYGWGRYDAKRAARGQVQASDVAPLPPNIPPISTAGLPPGAR